MCEQNIWYVRFVLRKKLKLKDVKESATDTFVVANHKFSARVGNAH